MVVVVVVGGGTRGGGARCGNFDIIFGLFSRIILGLFSRILPALYRPTCAVWHALRGTRMLIGC